MSTETGICLQYNDIEATIASDSQTPKSSHLFSTMKIAFLILISIEVSFSNENICTVEEECSKKEQNLSGSVNLYSEGM